MAKVKRIKIPADDRLARFTFSNTVRAAGLIREFPSMRSTWQFVEWKGSSKALNWIAWPRLFFPS
jgi:hypothetical protein